MSEEKRSFDLQEFKKGFNFCLERELSLTDLKVIMAIWDKEVSIQDIMSSFNLTYSSVTSTLARLQMKGITVKRRLPKSNQCVYKVDIYG